MHCYKAPLRDLDFIRYEVLDFDAHCRAMGVTDFLNREAFAELAALGWPMLTHAEEFGGQGMPDSLGLVTGELLASACWAWSIYPGLSIGAVRTIETHGTTDQKKRFIPKLVSGEWTGTTCLTEPHCGSDLGLLTTKAVPQADGSYQLHGSKIFITGGDDDLGSNIVHIVLQRHRTQIR